MESIIESLREIVGRPDFYKVLSGNNPTWDYGAMVEYFCAVMILCIVIASVFRFLGKLVSR